MYKTVNHVSKITIILSLLYCNRQQKCCDDAPPQDMTYEPVITPEDSTNPKTDAEPKTHELSSLQLVKNTAYADKTIPPPAQKESKIKGSTQPIQYDTTTDQEMPPASPSSGEPPTYSYLEHVPASCDTTSAREWESQYSKLSYDNMETDPTSKEHSPKSEARRKKSKPNGR